MAEKNTTAWRLTDETRDRLAEVAKQFSSKEAAMSAMLTALELSGQAQEMPERQRTIEDFQALTSRMVELYTESLKSTTDAETRIRAEMKARIDADGQTITKLQAGIKEAIERRTRAEAEAEDLTLTLEKRTKETEAASAETRRAREEAEDMRRALTDKQALLAMAQTRAEENEAAAAALDNAIKDRNAAQIKARDEASRADEAAADLQTTLDKIAEINQIRFDAADQVEKLQADLAQTKADAKEAEYAARDKLEALRAEAAETIYKAREEAQNQTAAIYGELAQLQKRYGDATERAAKAEKAQGIAEADLTSALETVADLRNKLEESKDEAKQASAKLTALLTEKAKK